MLEDLVLWVWSVINSWQVYFILGHIGVNVVAAVAAAIRTGEFQLHRTGEFLYRKILPLVMVYVALALLGRIINFEAMATVAWAAIEASLLGDLLDSLHKLGLAVPESLTKDEGYFLTPEYIEE